MNQDVAILIHPFFGMLGLLSVVWLVAEAINANNNNVARIKKASILAALFFILAWIAGGHWYVTYYKIDKQLILNGPWPFAHDFFMEVKEHLFFIPLLLALYLPIITNNDDVVKNNVAKKLLISVASIIIVLTLFIEGAGAIISNGVKVAYEHNTTTRDVE